MPHLLIQTSSMGEMAEKPGSSEVRLSEGLDLLHTKGQRGPSNDRWIDDGQPQAGAPATEIAQVIEEQFLLPLCSVPATNASIERRFQNSGVLENKPFDNPLSNDGQVVVDGDYTSCNQAEVQQGNDNEVTHYQPNPTAKNIPGNKQVDSWSSFSDADGDGITIPQPLISSPDSSPTGNAGKSTSARTTSRFGLRLSPKSPAADDILEGTSSTSQSRIFGKLTKRLYDVSLFEGKVASLPFDDHNCPLTQLIISLKKCKHLSYDRALQAVERICLEEGKKRGTNSLLEHRSYDSVQRQQREKLVENEHDPLFISSRFEVNVISNVLKEADNLNVNRYRCEDTYGGITSQFCDLECGEDSNWRTEDQMHQVETSIEIARNMQFVNGM
ncbi:hypothetical protein POTOM_012246 [Populus tomentosa]|uniref:DUF629 domain-containing protein n=1 Tax=Populus tomentosa TaxID=118781 RepID=A0A8X8D0J5_POPTO|nr:hypothetical protein POTOM_012246 [Populus tomentosa]